MALSNQYRPPNSFEETVMDTNHGDWADLVASLEDRYTSTTPVADGNGSEHPLQSHPAIAGSLDKIARLPTSEDYRCWRVRCKVFISQSYFSTHLILYTFSWASRLKSFFLCVDWYCRSMNCDLPS